MLVLAIMLAIGVAAILWHLSRLSSNLVASAALQGTSMYSEGLAEFRTLYTSEVVDRVIPHGIEVTHDYLTREGAIPLPATLSMELGKHIGEKGSGMQARLYSDYPFPWRKDGGPRDDFEREALRQLRQHSGQTFVRIEDFQGRRSLRYATADRMQAGCITCHNSHPDSPKTDWKVGDMRGILEVIHPLDTLVAQTRSGLLGTFVLMATMTVFVLFVLGMVINRLRRTSTELDQRASDLECEITERKQVEVALRQSEERTRLIVESALDAVITMDAQGLITSWNPQAETIFGWSREDAIGSRLAETIIPLQYREAHYRGLQKFLDTGEGPWLNKRIEIAALHRDGHEFPVELTISPLQSGKTFTFSAFIRDISERKLAEAELQQAKDAAEAASHAKSAFLANMSHELATPLNAILGYTELILDNIYGEVPGEVRDVLERAQRSGRHLLNLINDVFDLSKIEAGQLTLSLTDYSMREVVQTVSTTVESLAAEKNLALKITVPADLPPGRGDERRLTQVLLNLVGNAIKFTEVGEVRMEVRAFEGAFLVSVADTGPGIAEADQQKIFAAFQQADSSSTRKKGGTGLGLSIARKIIELHGGRIGVESNLGKGSTFWFSVPIRVERQTEGT